MDSPFHEVLRRGAQALSLELDERAMALLERYADQLLLWNRKVNLTAVTEAGELAEKHLVDSLALLRVLGAPAGRTLLDIGSGGGLPGVALACARADLHVTCCDSVAKKVAFLKWVSAELGLNVKAEAVRAAGDPDREGLPRAVVVVSRALTDVSQWVPLGSCYVAPGGTLLAMLGRNPDEQRLREIGETHGLALEQIDRFELPMSGAERAIVVWGRSPGVPRGTASAP